MSKKQIEKREAELRAMAWDNYTDYLARKGNDFDVLDWLNEKDGKEYEKVVKELLKYD